ncbi:AcrR family transcriptional regulator [Streptomyces sp. SAI-135]|uniref:ScbR family autoregulator-binding transcription factor n=1 Tax=unclassified Streptomyces TaxID=2593676 RepID=UPI0024739C8D|nr:MULTISPECIES: ScbR family autoregulator-binding transcription factor [unclassified Streptomyces]MDH6515766.1 AcrR family transcriptional regulator [Streptomyces sp. SAI-090]MDH6547981.1 AcrR family transcriptional regulator [Streptomyces sp. SAI-041]MDH6567070.1 AcrR family transcriptional regulator [Streptomyces sp. SAI-117]MDH6587995.1 AcrR family transcriptional regulator [Streptomyces sp. SAI-133]MDH6620149.1 AcrR family transcriptional regulator [Streptomyces sp. SAI-135]
MARQERAIRTRKAIVEAAGAVFDEHGYAASTIAMVLERAEVTKGALYFHFPSKESLAQAVLDEQLSLGAVPPHPCKVQEIVDMTFVFGHRLRTNALLKGSVRLTVDQCAPPGVDHTGPFRQWSEHLVAMLQEARAQGELLPTVEPRNTADLLVGAFAGVQLMSRALHGREDLGHRISVLWAHVLPSIVVPALLIGIDSRPDRGARVLASVGSGELVGAEA